MMNTVILTLKTACHLKPEQMFFRILRKMHKPAFRKLNAPSQTSFGLRTATIPKTQFLFGDLFRFHNIEGGFQGWNDMSHGLLWVYSLNCMDWLEQKDIDPKTGAYWIDMFIKDEPANSIGMNPYPTAIRCMNWLKFLSAHTELATAPRLDSLYSQLIMLSRMTERHILGNHILEDAITLYVGAKAFNDNRLYRKANKLLMRELSRQVLPDGAHFEQSPTYHCVMTEKVLDCLNLTSSAMLEDYARRMIGHLKNIVWSDMTTPLFGDSNYGSESEPPAILDYAKRLGIDSAPAKMNECGYRRYVSERFEAILDVGNITASYQPGHSHADTFNYEMRIDGKPFIVDTGISTYDKNERRQYERGTFAHNTVVYDGLDSSQVWGGFRIASRASVRIIKETDNHIEASHDGFGKSHIHTRSFNINSDGMTIMDSCPGNAKKVSVIHFSPDTGILSYDTEQIKTDKATIMLTGATDIQIIDTLVSQEFNKLLPSRCAVISFSGTLTQQIVI